MPDRDADVELDPQLALDLVRAQFGDDFDASRAEKLGAGWDNVAYRVDGRAVFRFPRRAFAVPFLKRETVWLPRLVDRLSLPVPEPEWIGQPTEAFDRPFVGYRYIPGTTLCSADVAREDRVEIAGRVGAFCRELHSMDLSEYGEPPPDLIPRRDLDRRLDFINKRMIALRERGMLHDGAIMELAVEMHRRASDDGVETWVHGDLYARHVLVVEDGSVSGIVDWGDLHYGDPAGDLSIAWTAFDFDGRFEFFHSYGQVDDNVRYRAILRAIHYALTLLDYGHDVGDAALITEGNGALRELLQLEI